MIMASSGEESVTSEFLQIILESSWIQGENKLTEQFESFFLFYTTITNLSEGS